MTTISRPSHMDETLFNRLKTIFPSEDDLKAVVDKLAGERLDHADDLSHETIESLSDKNGINLPRGFARKIVNAFASDTPTATATATPAAVPGQQQLPTTIKFVTDKGPNDMPVKELITRFASGDREPEVLSAMRTRVGYVLVDKNDLAKVEVDETAAWLASSAPKGTMQGFVRGKYAVLSIDDVVEPKIELDAIDGTELDRGFNNTQSQDWSGYDRPLRAFLYYAFRSGEFKGSPPTNNYTQILDAVDAADKSLETLGTKRGWNTVVDAWNFARRRDEGLEARMIQAVYPTRASRARTSGLDGQRGGPFEGSTINAQTVATPARVMTALQMDAFKTALLSAFISRSDLDSMVRLMDINLDAITGPVGLSQVVTDLLKHCESTGHLIDLLKQARKTNPGNPTLKAFAQEFIRPPFPSKLSGQEFQALHTALLDAYPTPDALALLVRQGLDENVNEIAASGSGLSSQVFALVVWCEACGRTERFVKAALHFQPNNAKLKAFTNKYDLS